MMGMGMQIAPEGNNSTETRGEASGRIAQWELSPGNAEEVFEHIHHDEPLLDGASGDYGSFEGEKSQMINHAEDADFVAPESVSFSARVVSALGCGSDMHIPPSERHKLAQLPATSIAGNDITSSVFYVSGVCAYYAGIWSPLSLIMVSVVVLYAFRGIYAEVITALPVNGGTYTVLLNTTDKWVASLAAALTVVSYLATAVVSANTAVKYLHGVIPAISPSWGTIALLGIFAALNLLGLSESAKVATAIFLVHMSIMVALVVDCFFFAVGDNFALLAHNWEVRGNATYTFHCMGNPEACVMNMFPLGTSLLFGFSSAMLGITGFETSANYVEEQRKGVFVKTLRNMWWCVALLNPTIGFLSLCTLPLSEVRGYPLVNGVPTNQNLLQSMAKSSVVRYAVSLDAFMVLAGAVLTSYVGVTGLVVRMSVDRVLPLFLAVKSKTFGSYPIIVIGFFLLTTSLFFMTNENVLILASVYTVSFLSVMALFAVGDLVVKYKRSRLRRDHHAKVPAVLFALLAVLVAIYGSVILNASTIGYWFIYYGTTLLIVGFMFQRVRLLRMVVRMLTKHWPRTSSDGSYAATMADVNRIPGLRGWVARKAITAMVEIQEEKFVFFIKEADIRLMNKAIEYVRGNELTQNLFFVHVHVVASTASAAAAGDELKLEDAMSGNTPVSSSGFGEDGGVSATLSPSPEELRGMSHIAQMRKDLTVLGRIYPKMKLDFAAISSTLPFEGRLVNKIGQRLGVAPNNMFISCPTETFKYDVAELGGVRLITGTRW